MAIGSTGNNDLVGGGCVPPYRVAAPVLNVRPPALEHNNRRPRDRSAANNRLPRIPWHEPLWNEHRGPVAQGDLWIGNARIANSKEQSLRTPLTKVGCLIQDEWASRVLREYQEEAYLTDEDLLREMRGNRSLFCDLTLRNLTQRQRRYSRGKGQPAVRALRLRAVIPH